MGCENRRMKKYDCCKLRAEVEKRVFVEAGDEIKWNETFVKKLAVKPWVLTVLVKYVEILYAVWHRVKSAYIGYVCTFHFCFFCFRSRCEVCVFEICLVSRSLNAHANRIIYQIGKTFVHNLGNKWSRKPPSRRKDTFESIRRVNVSIHYKPKYGKYLRLS